MKSKEIREKYINFFKNQGHVELPSASLMPENDPSALFISAGMHPLVPFLLGEKHPAGKKLVNCQKCIRTIDIDEVGDKVHHTFFEMLGHWSLNDYWKKEALQMTFEFLTQELGLEKDKLAVSVFEGDPVKSAEADHGASENNVSADDESVEIWKSLGISEKRIRKLSKKENWWEPGGSSGPCGPDTEVFYWASKDDVPQEFNPQDANWVEVSNDVLMQYEKKPVTILVDAVYCLMDKEKGINKELLNTLNSLKNKKIVVTNATLEKLKEFVPEIEKLNLEIFSLLKKPEKTEPEYFEKLLQKYNLEAEEVIYFDHSQENLDSAQKAGIQKTFLYTGVNDELKNFINNNLSYYKPALQKNIDNGTGLERLTAVLNGWDDDYKTDLFKPIIKKIEELSEKKYGEDKEITCSMRIIADHLRAAIFIMGDDLGIAPSNVDQGYVVRKLIRRAIRHGKLIGISEVFCFKIVEVVIKLMQEVYPELQKNKDFVINQMVEEEEKFRKTIEQGLKEFEKMKPKFISALGIGNLSKKSGLIKEPSLSANLLFNLYTTYGFPIELSLEEIKKMYKEFKDEKNIKIPIIELSKEDEKRLINEFYKSLKKHQELSRTAAAGKFKGGLANASEKTVKYHTTTHLLLAALRQVLGNDVLQKGSNINEERIRFDFSYDKKLTDEQKVEVEKSVNEWIEQDLPIVCQEMSLAKAKDKASVAVFDNKYGDRVKVFTIGDETNPVSCEICGGPHVDRTGKLGKFKIIKEQSSSSGVRRIKAVLE